MKLKSGRIPKNTKKIYCVVCNLGGFLWKRVVVLKRDGLGVGGDYWANRKENFCEEELKLGHNHYGGGFLYVFKDKRDAELFLEGGLAACREIAQKFNQYLPNIKE